MDYATVEALFFVTLSALALVARRREGCAPAAQNFGATAVAAFALADRLADRARAAGQREPKGFDAAVRDTLACRHAAGAWSALALASLRTAAPASGRTVTALLFCAGAERLIQTGRRARRSMRARPVTAKGGIA